MIENIKKQNILIANPSSDLGGVSNYILNILEYLSKEKYNIYIASNGNGKFAEESIKYGARIINFSFKYGFLDIKKFKKILRDNNIEIIHAHTTRAGLISALSKNKKCKLIFTGHGWRFLQKKNILLKLFFYIIALYICFKSNIVTCISYFEYNQGFKYKLLKQNKTKVVYFSLDIPNEQEIDHFWKTKLSPSKKIVVNVGRIVFEKDFETFLKVTQEVNKFNDVTFVWVGDGELRKKMEEEVNKLKLNDKIIITGFLNKKDVLSILKESDVFLLTSVIEGLPLSLIEAMSCQTPVVASDVGAISEVITDKKNGFIFKKKKYLEAANGVSTLINNANLCKIYSNLSLKIIENKFSPKAKMSEDFSLIYDSLV